MTLLRRWQREPRVLVGRERARPRVEQLDRRRAGPHLGAGEGDREVGEPVASAASKSAGSPWARDFTTSKVLVGPPSTA